MGFLAEEDQALLWRGLILNKAVQQFIEDADWSGIDYLLVDLPPGTSDVPMGLARTLPQTVSCSSPRRPSRPSSSPPARATSPGEPTCGCSASSRT